MTSDQKHERPTVLIVDDDITNIQVAAAHLKSDSISISYAMSAEEAWTRILAVRPRLILLDIMMPMIDGISFCKDLKQNLKFRDIPVIFLTAKVDKETLVQAFEAGGVDYITKPFFGPELVHRVRIHIEFRELLEKTEQMNTELNLQILKAMKAEEESQEYQRDIVAANLKLKELASHDSLTGLLNRRRAWELIEYEVHRSKRHDRIVSFLIIDIDNFKNVNDRYGHAKGDQVLLKLSQLMKSIVRRQDVVARWGGEEFLIALPETSIDEAAGVAEKIRLASEQIKWDFTKNLITLSIGVSNYAPEQIESDVDFGVSISLADKALYYSKEHGKNRVTKSSELLDN